MKLPKHRRDEAALNSRLIRRPIKRMGGFLAGNVQHLGELSQFFTDLEHQCRFANTRRTAHQDQ